LRARRSTTAAAELEHVNRIGNDAAPDWPSGTETDVYRVDIEGTPSIYQETAFRFTDGSGRDAAAAGCLATGLRALNAVPAVNDLSPGWGDSFGSTTDSRCGDHSLVTSTRQTTLFTGSGLGRYRVRCLTG
jgi:hypothetical protein